MADTNKESPESNDEHLVVYPLDESRLQTLRAIDDRLGLEPGHSFVTAVDLLEGVLEQRSEGYTKLQVEDPSDGSYKELHIGL